MTSGAPSRRFEYVTLAIFALFVGTLTSLHEPWRDETQSWRLAIDSDGVGALFHNARYEGHPLLFHLLVQALGHLSRSWWAVATLHAVIACAAAWIVLRYAPFSRLQKILAIFGYFPAYEFAVIVRPYGLGMLFAFAACASWTAERRRPLVTILFLILLANTSVFGLLLSLASGASFLVEWLWPDDGPMQITGRVTARATSCIVLMIAVICLVRWQVIPPSDAVFKGNGVAATGASAWSLGVGGLSPFWSAVPLAKIGDGTVEWNNWLFTPQSRMQLLADLCVSGFIVLAGFVVACRRRTSLIFYICSTFGLIAFFELFVTGSARHYGHLALAWIMSAWLSRSGSATKWRVSSHLSSERVRRLSPGLLSISLVPMALATLEFSASDILRPFSDVPGVVRVLKARGLSNDPLIGVARAHAQAVGALLDRPVAYPSEGRTSTFVVWGAARADMPTADQLDGAIDSLLERSCRVVLISVEGKELPPRILSRSSVIYRTSYRPMSNDRYVVSTSTARRPGC